ncbi:MAG: hypothetical protein QHI48_05475 [Bacteroidota bacterium]|nr:hypothetical protein [Bacteroidota bacterium]
MDTPTQDLLCYSIGNVRRQIETVQPTLGWYVLRFYALHGRPSKTRTAIVETFYYFPSGGTLRDKDMNIVIYEPRLDRNRSAGIEAGECPSTRA